MICFVCDVIWWVVECSFVMLLCVVGVDVIVKVCFVDELVLNDECWDMLCLL